MENQDLGVKKERGEQENRNCPVPPSLFERLPSAVWGDFERDGGLSPLHVGSERLTFLKSKRPSSLGDGLRPVWTDTHHVFTVPPDGSHSVMFLESV